MPKPVSKIQMTQWAASEVTFKGQKSALRKQSDLYTKIFLGVSGFKFCFILCTFSREIREKYSWNLKIKLTWWKLRKTSKIFQKSANLTGSLLNIKSFSNL